MTDKTLEYDAALRQSRIAALRRRVPGGSVMNMSTLMATGAGGHSMMGASVFGDPANAPSVVLGDSQGSQQLGQATPRSPPASAQKTPTRTTPGAGGSGSEILLEDGGVGSGLGGSYVDGTKRFGGKEEEEEEGMEDGGVLGLLAQVYGRRDGPPVVI